MSETVNDQVSETAESQVEETVENQVTDEEVLGQVGQLLNDQEEVKEESQEQKEEVKEEEQPKEVQEEPKTDSVKIIDEAMIQEFPALKMYMGKPINEALPKAYQNIVKAYYEDHKKLIQYEKEKANKIPEPSEVPDPIEKGEDFKKWLADYTEQIKQSVRAEAPPQQIDWIKEVEKVIPQGMDAQKVIQSWTNFNAPRIFNEYGDYRPEVQRFYDEHPEILLNEIGSFANLSTKAEKNEMAIKEESNKKAYNTVKTSLKNAKENKENLTNSQFNATQRTEEVSEEEQILANIYKISQGQ